MRLRAKDIQEQTFRVTFRGFDPVEVDSFLKRLADELERLHEERANLELELDVERAGRKSLEEALDSAGKIHEAMAEKAREEARLIVERAKLEAERQALESRERLGDLQKDIERLEQKRVTLLSELTGLAEGLTDWLTRQAERTPAPVRAATPVKEAPKASAYEEIIEPEPIELPKEEDDPSFVLHENRSQMLMDLVDNPDTYNPAGAKAQKGAETEEELEPIEIIEELSGDLLIPRK